MAGDTARQAANVVRETSSDREKFLSYRVDLPTTRNSVTVTFDFGDGDLRTLVAPTRREAFEQARRRWGDGWVDEPVVTSPRVDDHNRQLRKEGRL